MKRIIAFILYLSVLPCFAQIGISPGPTPPPFIQPVPSTTAWTPTDASGAGLTFLNISATCLNIATTLSWCRAKLDYPTTVSAANASIGGLPFTSTNAPYSQASCGLSATNSSTVQEVLLGINSTSVSLLTNAGVAIANSVVSGGTVWFNCLYSH